MSPQLLAVTDVADRATGWYLPRGGSQWASVTEHPPPPAIGQLCWWSPDAPPGGGWWRPRKAVPRTS